jgi:hypothetical protein
MIFETAKQANIPGFLGREEKQFLLRKVFRRVRGRKI